MNIAQLKQQLQLEHVVQETTHLQPKGSIYVGRCPFHQDTGRPNLVIFPKTQTWTCFVCGFQGDVIDWISRTTHQTATAVLQQYQPSRHPSGTAKPPSTPPAVRTIPPQATIASPATRHRIYEQWLHTLTLSPTHTLDLLARGLDFTTIAAHEFRTYTPGPIDPSIRPNHVPGFYQDTPGHWVSAEPGGLVIPIRDLHQHIVGCQIRLDPPNTAGKYRWFSSGSPKQSHGTATSALVHLEPGTSSTVWITEGPLKAIRLHQTTGDTTLGLPGATTWRNAIPLLQTLRPRQIVIALDQDPDPRTRTTILANATRLATIGYAEGWAVAYAEWTDYKGIDDALEAHHPITITTQHGYAQPHSPTPPQEVVSPCK